MKVASQEHARARRPLSVHVPPESDNRGQLTREYRQTAYELRVRSTAVGRVLAAYMTEGQVRALWDRIESCIESKKGPPSQLQLNEDEFMAELALVRGQGYCLMRFEPHNESCALAAPIFDRTGNIGAAISVSCKRHLPVWNDEAALSGLVMEAAQEISFRLQNPKVIHTVRRDQVPTALVPKVRATELPARSVPRSASR